MLGKEASLHSLRPRIPQPIMASDSAAQEKADGLAAAYCDQNGAPDPARAPEILEHQEAQTVLRQAQAQNRLHHAWLISGARGIGKATLAWAWARFLLHYGDGDGDDAAGLPTSGLAVPSDSRAASLLARRAHPDFLHVHPEWDARSRAYRQSLSAAVLRRIPSLFALQASSHRGWRVCLIDSADALTPTAANALLKILEEPPPRALFLIVCHQPGRLLATIRSRCQMLPLKSLSEESVAQILALYFPAMADSERRDLAQLGQGSAGQALNFARSGGQEVYVQTLQILQSLPHLPYEAMHTLADGLAQTGVSQAAPRFARFAELLLGILHRCALHRYALHSSNGAPEALLPPELSLGEKWAQTMPLHHLAQIWSQLAALVQRNAELQLDGRQSLLACFGLLAEGMTAKHMN